MADITKSQVLGSFYDLPNPGFGVSEGQANNELAVSNTSLPTCENAGSDKVAPHRLLVINLILVLALAIGPISMYALLAGLAMSATLTLCTVVLGKTIFSLIKRLSSQFLARSVAIFFIIGLTLTFYMLLPQVAKTIMLTDRFLGKWLEKAVGLSAKEAD